MQELKIETFYEFIIELLENLEIDVVRENPDSKATFPCIVVQSPTRYDEIIGDGNLPIYARFSITCEAWTKKKSTSITLSDTIDDKLRNYNILRSGTPIDLYDSNTGCHRYGGTYEVFFNALNGSFQRIK